LIGCSEGISDEIFTYSNAKTMVKEMADYTIEQIGEDDIGLGIDFDLGISGSIGDQNISTNLEGYFKALLDYSETSNTEFMGSVTGEMLNYKDLTTTTVDKGIYYKNDYMYFNDGEDKTKENNSLSEFMGQSFSDLINNIMEESDIEELDMLGELDMLEETTDTFTKQDLIDYIEENMGVDAISVILIDVIEEELTDADINPETYLSVKLESDKIVFSLNYDNFKTTFTKVINSVKEKINAFLANEENFAEELIKDEGMAAVAEKTAINYYLGDLSDYSALFVELFPDGLEDDNFEALMALDEEDFNDSFDSLSDAAVAFENVYKNLDDNTVYINWLYTNYKTLLVSELDDTEYLNVAISDIESDFQFVNGFLTIIDQVLPTELNFSFEINFSVSEDLKDNTITGFAIHFDVETKVPTSLTSTVFQDLSLDVDLSVNFEFDKSNITITPPTDLNDYVLEEVQ